MSKVIIEFSGIARGTTVYVSLGHQTVKSGSVVGHRVTEGGVSPLDRVIEYGVKWFGSGDRSEYMEWHRSADVHTSPKSAFGIDQSESTGEQP